MCVAFFAVLRRGLTTTNETAEAIDHCEEQYVDHMFLSWGARAPGFLHPPPEFHSGAV